MSIFGDYSQSELDAQYNQRTLVPDLQPYLREWEIGAQRAERLKPTVGLSYGQEADENIAEQF